MKEQFELSSKQFIARGAFGKVERFSYKSDPQKFVACKTITFPATSTAGRTKDAAILEYSILSDLKHPNIVQYIDFECSEQEAQLYMEFCDRGSLQDHINQQKPKHISEEFIWNVLAQISSALMYCHYGVTSTGEIIGEKQPERQILHRDIKPGNVLLCGNLDDTVTTKLGDFGLGVIIEDGNVPDSYVGTKQYTAPEINNQVQQRAWTDKCDIFSLGCTLHALCKGEPPFGYRMENEADLRQITFSEEYSTDLKNLVLNCLSYKPESRQDAIKIHNLAEEQLRMTDQHRPMKPLVGHTKVKLLPGAPIAATCWPGWHYRVYFQDSSGGIREARHDSGVWTGGDLNSKICQAKLFTPLAVVSDSTGKEIRVFYLTENHTLQEHRYSARSGWRPGKLNRLLIEASPDSQIAAVWLSSGIRVYYQEPTKNTVQEYSCRVDKGCQRYFQRSKSTWQKGATIHTSALQGTSLACSTWGGDTIRLYYQDNGQELREHCCEGAGQKWVVGHMSVGTIPKNTPISSFAWCDQSGGIQIRVYWHDASKNLVELKWSNGWHPVNEAIFMGNTQFSAVQWDGGNHIRAYYQGSDHSIMEKCFSNSSEWYNGSRVDAMEE